MVRYFSGLPCCSCWQRGSWMSPSPCFMGFVVLVFFFFQFCVCVLSGFRFCFVAVTEATKGSDPGAGGCLRSGSRRGCVEGGREGGKGRAVQVL